MKTTEMLCRVIAVCIVESLSDFTKRKFVCGRKFNVGTGARKRSDSEAYQYMFDVLADYMFTHNELTQVRNFAPTVEIFNEKMNKLFDNAE